MAVLKLTNLEMGMEAEVRALTGHPLFRNRLLSLGITPHSRVVLLRRLPMGGPLEVEVRGTRLAIRRKDADQIWVMVAGEASAEEASVGDASAEAALAATAVPSLARSRCRCGVGGEVFDEGTVLHGTGEGGR
ncbi:ferrous iron transport protein A [Alicyclobacillus sp.]|uniref:FeoA family protein n=1 Tax=Alicyclobacillus sp. TaxID=61169 RepID=UPI0025BC40A2|nr:ferrous iron transport protein A [Alicyclobacillus sp.]MCL6516986.1 ferrous iron transport protein A [Alicyclobacillus sp.]